MVSLTILPHCIRSAVVYLRHLPNNCNRSDVNFMDSSDFHQFRAILDSELNQLNATRKYIEKCQA